MMFADSAPATADALQRTFALPREVAERMVNEVPVVVKRGAGPAEAAELLDALQRLGAQVVLLPSTGARPSLATPEAVEPKRAAWGGLDFQPELAVRASIELAPQAADEPGGFSRPSFAPRASVIPENAPASELRFELGAPAPHAMPEIPRLRSEAPAPRAQISEPPEFPSLAPRGDVRLHAPGDAGSPALPLDQPDLGLGTVPPLPRVESSAPVLPSGPPSPPALPVGARAAAKPPPVPAAAKRPEPPPPPPPRASKSEVELPALELDERARTSGKGAAQPVRTRAQAQAPAVDVWTGRRAQQASLEPSRAGPAEPRAARNEKAADNSASVSVEAAKPAPVQARVATEEVEAPKARGLAILCLCSASAVVLLGLRFDNSVFYGDASPLWLVLHGFAFYAFGFAIAGLRR